MEFIISKTVLEDALRKVDRPITQRPVVPVLSGVHLVVKDDGLTLTGSDTDLSVRLFVPSGVKSDGIEDLEVITEGTIILPSKEFLSIARAMPENKVHIARNKSGIQITSGKSKFVLNGTDGDEYPRLPEVKGKEITIKKETLKNLIEQTIFAVSKQETRPILTGVNLFYEKNRLGMVATDSYRLSRAIGDEVEVNENFENITLPEKSLKELSFLINRDNAEEISLKRSNNQIFFETDNLQVYSRMLEGTYPETDRLIPKSHKTLVTVDRKGFLSAMERSSILAQADENKTVVFEVSGENNGIFDTIKLSHQEQKTGQSEEDIIVEEIEGDEIEVSFNAKFMIDALKSINTEEVLIKFNGSMRPFVLEPKGENGLTQLITPVRRY